MSQTSTALSGWLGYVLLSFVYTMLVGAAFVKLYGGRNRPTRVKSWRQIFLGHCGFLAILFLGYLLGTHCEPYLPRWLAAETIPGKNGHMDSWFEIICILLIAVLGVIEAQWIAPGGSRDTANLRDANQP